MSRIRKTIYILMAIALVLLSSGALPVSPVSQIDKLTPTPTMGPTPTETSVPTATPEGPTNTPEPGINIAAYPGAPLCEDSGELHDHSLFHSLWDAERGCHYDHEHGADPFTEEVANTFPMYDLHALLGNVEIGHTNPSSPAENVAKHGGFKWQVDMDAPQGCAVGFESGTVAVDAYVIEYHSFGPQSVELEARNHSSAALLRQCRPDNPADTGYIFVNQLQEFGERVMPYQGMTLPYPNNFQPEWNGAFGPYFTTECFGTDFYVGTKFIDCRNQYNTSSNNITIWTSKPTGGGARPETSMLFRFVFRARDAYQRLDARDLEHPFTWMFVCGGAVYNPVGCRYNNSSTTIHQIAGNIPAAWDGAEFDLDGRPGRVTAEGFVTRFGTWNAACTEVGVDCHPIKMIGAFVGKYSSEISIIKVSNPGPIDTPERDIYFCNGVVCSETSTGAVPSGWIGAEN